MKDTMKICSLEQIRLLTDPLKLQLIQAFAEGEKTTKQVAAELNQSVTRLYRHVDALHEADLLEIVRETPKRGTVERTFRAVARRFEADQGLFSDNDKGESVDAVRDMLRSGENEIIDAIMQHDGGQGSNAIFLRLRSRHSPEHIEELRRTLNEWVESAQCDNEDEDSVEVGAMIAFYPISDDRS
jgi:predicted ArsR family transcriptional regulator